MVDVPYTPEVGERITSALRVSGCAMEGVEFYVDCGGVHVDVNYAHLTLTPQPRGAA
ncbi:MAG: hypothetical protein QXP98_10415 [Thermoproteus sp.]